MTVSECSYHGNIATGQGGALYLQEVSPITITRTDFEHNQAVVGGGALYLTEHLVGVQGFFLALPVTVYATKVVMGNADMDDDDDDDKASELPSRGMGAEFTA